MHATVIKSHGNLVTVSTDFGTIEGVWMEDEPAKLKKYILELDSDEIIAPHCISISEHNSSNIIFNGKTTVLVGMVEDFQDNIMYLVVCGDIIMLNISPDIDCIPFIHKYVDVRLKQLNFYDTGMCC